MILRRWLSLTVNELSDDLNDEFLLEKAEDPSQPSTEPSQKEIGKPQKGGYFTQVVT
jgi:hypothetical protein